MSGAFAAAALQLRDCGLAPIPLGGDDGKAPKVHGFNAWTVAPSLETYAKWTRRFSNENVGTPTGCASKVFVVDADERGLEGKIKERFGATPLWVTSPRGGMHAYYRYGGETCGNLRAEGLPIDFKGWGGIVVLPPVSARAANLRAATTNSRRVVLGRCCANSRASNPVR